MQDLSVETVFSQPLPDRAHLALKSAKNLLERGNLIGAQSGLLEKKIFSF
jgi:hypothetical protein